MPCQEPDYSFPSHFPVGTPAKQTNRAVEHQTLCDMSEGS